MKESDQIKRLDELITPEFLATLAEVGRIGGWTFSSDYYEVMNFIEELYSFAEIEPPDLNGCEIEYEYLEEDF
jgi:hypothetical protein